MLKIANGTSLPGFSIMIIDDFGIAPLEYSICYFDICIFQGPDI